MYYILWVCVCIEYAMRVFSAFCYLRPVRLHHIFSYYFMNGMILEENIYCTQDVCFDCLYIFSEIFLIIRAIQNDMIKNVKYSLVCRILIKFYLLVRFAKKSQKLQISWKYVQ